MGSIAGVDVDVKVAEDSRSGDGRIDLYCMHGAAWFSCKRQEHRHEKI